MLSHKYIINTADYLNVFKLYPAPLRRIIGHTVDHFMATAHDPRSNIKLKTWLRICNHLRVKPFTTEEEPEIQLIENEDIYYSYNCKYLIEIMQRFALTRRLHNIFDLYPEYARQLRLGGQTPGLRLWLHCINAWNSISDIDIDVFQRTSKGSGRFELLGWHLPPDGVFRITKISDPISIRHSVVGHLTLFVTRARLLAHDYEIKTFKSYGSPAFPLTIEYPRTFRYVPDGWAIGEPLEKRLKATLINDLFDLGIQIQVSALVPRKSLKK